VKGGRFEARLAPGAQKEMVDVLDEGADGTPVVRLGSVDYPVGARPRHS